MSRVRGFAGWRPQAKTRVFLDHVNVVLVEYHAYLPMTCRQVFYRLVGVHEYPKTEAAYESLQEMLVRARRAGIVRFSAIRDDGISARVPWGYDSEADFWSGRFPEHSWFQFHRQAGQPRFVEV